MLTALALCTAHKPCNLAFAQHGVSGRQWVRWLCFEKWPKAAEHNKEHNLDLCPSQIVGLAGQWSAPQGIYTSFTSAQRQSRRKFLAIQKLGEATKSNLSPETNKTSKPELDGQV